VEDNLKNTEIQTIQQDEKVVVQPISFGARNKPSCPIEFTESKEIVKPIEFEKREIVKPIEYTERREIVKPISFFAYKADANGVKEIDVDNPELAGSIILPKEEVPTYKELFQKFKGIAQQNTSVNSKIKNNSQIVKAQTENQDNEIASLTNYQLYPLKRKIYVNRDGEVDYEKSEVEVQIVIGEFGKVSKTVFPIRYAEIDKITKIVGRRFPDAIIYDKKQSDSVENDFREKVTKAKAIRCFTDAGWHVVDEKRVYLHKAIVIPNMEMMMSLKLPCNNKISNRGLGAIWKTSLSIYSEKDVAAVLILYSFLGVSYKLFDEAGFAPHFLLFMTGKTGSFKTTIAKLLFTQLADERYRDFPRRIDADTITSFERALVVSGVDTVTLIDDYSPAKSKQGASDMANKLESIIRMVGDGSTKSRSNVALTDRRGEGVRGMVALTGELQGKGLSSNLRCLYCEIEKEKVNLETVTWFQANKDYYCTLIQHFVYYLAENWECIKIYIQQNFDGYRRSAEGVLDARRLIDVTVTLWIIADILNRFLIEYCKTDEFVICSEFEEVKKGVIDVVKKSELQSTEEDSALIFMKTIADMLSSGKLLVSSEKNSNLVTSYYDGFMDENYVYLLPEDVYTKVTSYLTKCGIYFWVDMNHLGSMLCKEGYAISTPNGANKRVYYARVNLGEGRKVNFIKIPKKVIEKLQDSMECKE